MGNMAGMGMEVVTGGSMSILTIVKYILATVGGGALLGLVGGLVFAGIRYPNPDKQHLFTAKQKILVLCVALVGFGLIIGALFYPQDQGKKLGEDIMAMAMMDELGAPVTDENGLVLGQDGLPIQDENGMFRNNMGMPVDPAALPEPGATADSLPADASGAEDASGAASGGASAASGDTSAASGETASAAASGDASGSGAATPPAATDAPTGGTAGTGGGGHTGGNIIIGGGAVMMR